MAKLDDVPPLLPLLPAQRRIWAVERALGGSDVFHLHQAFRLRGRLDLCALETAANTVKRRQEALRTRIRVEGDGQAVQVVRPGEPGLDRLDLAGLEACDRDEALRAAITLARRAPFDLAEDDACRLVVVRLGADDHALLLTLHHVLADGWSLGVFWRELAAAYRCGQPTPSTMSWTDYVVEQSARWSSCTVSPVPLPRCEPLFPEASTSRRPVFQLGTIPLSFGGAESAAVDALCRRRRVTLFMVALAALADVLRRRHGWSRFPVGTTAARRDNPRVRALAGCVADTTVLDVDLGGADGPWEVLRSCRNAVLQALERPDVPFDRLVGNAGGARLFDVMLIEGQGRSLPELDGLILEPLGGPAQPSEAMVSDCSLIVQVWRDAGLVHGYVHHRLDVIDADSARTYAADLGSSTRWLVAEST